MKIKHIKVHAFLAAGGKLDLGDTLVGASDGNPKPSYEFTVVSTPGKLTFVSENFCNSEYVIFKNKTGEIITPEFGVHSAWYLLVDVGSGNRQKYFNKILKNRKQKAALAMMGAHNLSYNEELGEWE